MDVQGKGLGTLAMSDNPNRGQWQVLWHWRLAFSRGWWPREALPVFRYWNVGPIEIRHLMPTAWVWSRYSASQGSSPSGV